MGVLDWVSIFIAVMTAIALIITVRESQKQSLVQLFAHYNKEYTEIMRSIDPEVFNQEKRLEDFGEEKDKIINQLIHYFDLSLEEFRIMLVGQGIFVRNLWKSSAMLWLEGVKSEITTFPVFRDVYGELKRRRRYSANFFEYVDKITNPEKPLSGVEISNLFLKMRRKLRKQDRKI